MYPDGDKEDVLDDALDAVSPVLSNALTRENYLEHANVSPDGRTLYAARGHVGDVVAVEGRREEKFELDGDIQKILQYSEAIQIMTENAQYIDTGTV